MSSNPHVLIDQPNERQATFHRRAFIAGGVAGAALLALGGRLAQLQLLQSSDYALQARENQFNFRLVPPARGRIVDRDGRPIADNRPDFRLLVIRDEIPDLDETLNAVQTMVPISPNRRREILREVSQSPRYAPVAIATDLDWASFAAVNVRAPELPGVVPEMGEGRVYPFSGAFAHVVGYVGKINADEMRREGENPGPLLFHPGFRIGKTGVEKAFDRELRGSPGGRRVEVDARGRVIREAPEGNIPPAPGAEVRLTLDADVQTRALQVFEEESGAAVLIDVRNGDILCMASAPSFDANKFVAGMPGPEYRALAAYERRPLLDKAMSGIYPPGSTFKPITALAALKHGIDPNQTWSCGGGLNFGGRLFRCHGRHGSQNMVDALKNSCDVYFYQVSRILGPDPIAEMATLFGLGQRFELGIPGQSRGIVPSTAWKARYFARNPDPRSRIWNPGESLSYAIGQGQLAVTPLQLAAMVARIANGSTAIQPRLVQSVGGRPFRPASTTPLGVPAEHMRIIHEGMEAVTSAGGTAFRTSQLNLGPNIRMAGKTGTAQARTYRAGEARGGVGAAWGARDHNWFIAYAPTDRPRYAMALLVQHGGRGGGSNAAPRAREIMRVALLKDPEMRALIETPTTRPEPSAQPPAPGEHRV